MGVGETTGESRSSFEKTIFKNPTSFEEATNGAT